MLKFKLWLPQKRTFNFLTPLQTNLSKQPRCFYNKGKHDTVWHTWDQTKEYHTPNQHICNLKIVNKIYSLDRLRLEQTLCHGTIKKRRHDLQSQPVHESLGQKRDLPSGKKLWKALRVFLEWEVWIKDLKNQPNQSLCTLLALPASCPQSPEAC